MNRTQSYQAFASPAKVRKRQSDAGTKENMWSSLLDSVASGRRLPEKTVIVLGATSETQKDFLETLSSESPRKQQARHRKQPSIANEFALGYTYHDVLDTDHEDTLARLSIYTLPEPSPSFAPLLRPLFVARNIPDTLLLILLDWAEPWKWIYQLKLWIRLLRDVGSSTDLEASTAMAEVMQEWQQRRRGGTAYDGGAGGANSGSESNIAIPLGPGEWDEALGLPLCVVCHNSDKMDILERDVGWREEEFDYILQFLRTILLKHGASLVYTSNSVPNSLPTLVHSMLGIQSPLKRQLVKHNVVDRDKVLIPPNWDSWGKIRVLREGFNVEAISNGWGQEIEDTTKSNDNDKETITIGKADIFSDNHGPLVLAYEEIISDPKKNSATDVKYLSNQGLELETLGMQEFLAGQLEIMEQLKSQEEHGEGKKDPRANTALSSSRVPHDPTANESNRVNEHIGPVQFNIGGIQVDAEDMLKRLKDREREDTPDREGAAPATPEGKSQNEALANFFAGLMKKGGTNSPRQHVS